MGSADTSAAGDATPGAARTVAHAKALRAISQFMRSEVKSEESLAQITTVRSTDGSSKERTTLRTRTESIQVRSRAIIGQAFVVRSQPEANPDRHVVVLAMRLSEPK